MSTLTFSLPISLCESGKAFQEVAVCRCVSTLECGAGLSKRGRHAGSVSSAYGLNDSRQLPLPARRNGKQRRRIVAKSQASVASDVTVVENVGGAEAGHSIQNVVIVGAGIAGLAAALSLYRVGIKALVLEQSSTVRATGAALALWTNAWRALDYLGVGDRLRQNHILCSEARLYSTSEKLLKKINFDECRGGPHEIRSVERKALMDVLAGELPNDSIQLQARVRSIERQPKENFTKVYLENGSVIRAKVVIGCDGVNSVVNQWMGIPQPHYYGHMAVRGVAEFPGGHQYGYQFCQYMGNGTRAGVIPFKEKQIYWFVTWPSRDPGQKVTDPNLIKEETLRILEKGKYPDRVINLVHKTPLYMFSRAALQDRWNLPGITPPLAKDGITLAGDALHPMTPNLGQGGCTAIEDGIVIARCLAAAFAGEGATADGPHGAESIQKALEEYVAERQKRTLLITLRSHVMGVLLGIGFAPVIFVRNRIALPKLNSSNFLNHTLYDVGPLPATKVSAE